MSDSDVDVSEREVPDDSICPACRKSTYVGETISCETCLYWFHFECVGVTHNDECVKSEDVPYFCPPCSGRAPKFPPITKPAKKQTPAKKRKKEPAAKSAKKAPVPQAKPAPAEMGLPTTNPLLKSPSIKLKISTMAKKSPEDGSVSMSMSPLPVAAAPSSVRKRLDSEEEEEKWLHAVESGNLHTVDDELKRIRDPKLMTARQRAMITKKSEPNSPMVASSPQSPHSSMLPSKLFLSTPVNLDESGHVSLDYGWKKKTVQEDIDPEQRAIKSQKRKEIELEKREQDKKKTMDRLLLKKESKVAKTIRTTAAAAELMGRNPKWTYKLTAETKTLSMPKGKDYPLSPQKSGTPPVPMKCAVSDCSNIKKYNCAKTGKPLCSLKCYQKNMALLVAAT